MGKYYSYAQRLDTAYKDALDQFAKSWKNLMDAQEKFDDAKNGTSAKPRQSES